MGRRSSAGRPPATAVEVRREHLLDIASALFLENGYAATSLENVAQRAGVGKVTIYRHFTNKDGLFLAVVDGLILRIQPDAFPADGAMDMHGRLLAWAERVFDFSCRPETVALTRLIYAEAGRFPEIGQAYEECRRRHLIDGLRADIGNWRDGGQIVVDDVGRAAEMFVLMVGGGAIARRLCALPMDDGPGERATLIAMAVELFLQGTSSSRMK